MDRASYIDPLDGATYPLDQPRWCSARQTPLMVTPLSGIGRDDVERGLRSLWRYRAALPLAVSAPISLGEGCTPLVEKPWGDLRPFFKLDGLNPSGSFKDRGTSVMLSVLRQQGIEAVLEDSSGNGGSSVAAYGAAGGLRVKIFCPATTSPAKLLQARAYGAEIQSVDGPREASQTEAIRQSGDTFYASHNWQPFFLQGTKSLAYEIWEDLGFEAPDNIIMPVGAGSSLLGCAIGFTELFRAGQIATLPRLFAAQPLHCSPLDASFQAGVDVAVDRPVTPTIAEGTAIARPLRLKQIIAALRTSGGGTVALSETEIVSALRSLAQSGLYVEPTCATAVAALDRLVRDRTIAPRERTVVIITGTGLKTSGQIADLLR